MKFTMSVGDIASSLASPFWGPITDKEIKEANQGELVERVWKKVKIGVKATLPTAVVGYAILCTTDYWQTCETPLIVPFSTRLPSVEVFLSNTLRAPIWEEMTDRLLCQSILISALHGLKEGDPKDREKAEWTGIALAAIYFASCHPWKKLPGKLSTVFFAVATGHLYVRSLNAWDQDPSLRNRLESLLIPIVLHSAGNALPRLPIICWEGLKWANVVGNAVTKT